MRSLLLFFAGILLTSSNVLAFQTDQCLTCHLAIEDKPSALFLKDVHYKKGITCAGCHGGNAHAEDIEEGMSPKAGFIGVPKGNNVSAICSKCHSNASVMVKTYKSVLPLDQMELLASSVHGSPSTKGSGRIAQCTSCHGAHGIVPKTDRSSPVHPLNVPTTCSTCHSSAQYMRAYNPALPIDQLEKYHTSIHGRQNAKGDVKAVECASCHGSHEILSSKDVKSRVYPTNLPSTCASCHSNAAYMKEYKIPSDQFEKFSRSVHGEALLKKKDLSAPACNDCHGNHGATPPGVESISKVCGTCHALNAQLFSESPHKKAFDARKLPACETCHSHHEVIAATDVLLGVGEGTACNWCHGKDPASKGYLVARAMRQMADSLVAAENLALLRVYEAEQKGMEVGEAKFKLRDVRQALLETRTKVHSFDEDQFREVAQRGFTIAGEVSNEANMAVEEYFFRRWGLLVATLIITLLATSLLLYIRRIEREQNEPR